MSARLRIAALTAAAALTVTGMVGPSEAADVSHAPINVITGVSTGLDAPAKAFGGFRDAAGALYVPGWTDAAVRVFSPGAVGNATPERTIKGALTELSITSDVTVANGFIYASSYGSNEVMVFAPGANGNVAPVRLIGGALTGLVAPSGLAVDAQGYLYVANWTAGSVAVFAPGATGNVAPVRTITGAATQLQFPNGIMLTPQGDLLVANVGGNKVLTFPASANGNAVPTGVIAGPATTLSDPYDVTLDSDGNIYVANWSGQSLAVFAPGANGNVAPLTRLLGNATTQLSRPGAVFVHPDHRVTVTVNDPQAINTYAPLVAKLLVPGAVQGLKVSGKPAKSRRTVSWKAPASDGGTPVTAYQVVVRKGTKTLIKKTLPATQLKLVLKKRKLRNGKHTVTVTAINKIGSGPAVTKRFRVVK